MGEVYRARDHKLHRDVAIKVLPESVAEDPDRLARFEREARVLASVNHPNIAAIYGLEDSTSVKALVLELVAGPTLQDRIEQGAVPLPEARAIALQIADALEAAHERGIVHRDLKPANVKLGGDERVKVLDFGLAKALDSEAGASAPDLTRSPTLSVGTQTGMIIGTAAYMAPEQARGKKADKRADVWAFGVVLFEMLTGRRLFEGETVSDVLAAVLKNEPDFDLLPPGLPGNVRRVLTLCLQKDPKQRLHDIADARIELSRSESEPGQAIPAAAPPRRQRLAWAIAAAGVLLSIVMTAVAARRGRSESRTMKVHVLPPARTLGSGPIDISPDGRRLAFVAAGSDGLTKLYVRELDSLEARALPATEDAAAPFFSPDGRSVAFFADRKLKRIDLAGGPPQVLADAPDNRGGSWGAREIVFSPQAAGPLFHVPATGGSASPVTALAASPKEVSHRWPHFLPDGKHLVFMNRRATAPHRLTLEMTSIEGGKRTPIADAASSAAFARGRLYFLRGATLLAQPFDPDRGSLSGEPALVTDQVWNDPDTDGYSAFALAADGTLAFRGGAVPQYQMTWLDRQGHSISTVGPAGAIASVALSPDGRQAAFYSLDPDRDRSLVQTIDLAQGAVSLVADQASAQVFSPDGRQIVFASDLKGVFDLYRADSRGSGSASLLLANALWKFPESWSPDGRFLSFSQSKPSGSAGDTTDIWVLPMAENGKAFSLPSSSAQRMFSAFSPDGRYLAYCSDESGTLEVYVQTFPVTDAKWRVSSGGGSEPVWSRDGTELFYLASSATPGRRTVVATSVRLSPEFSADPPHPLFDVPLRVRGSSSTWPYAVSPDGKRFLAVVRIGESDASPIVVFTGDGR